MFKDESTHTFKLVQKVLQTFGGECVDWEPEVIMKSLVDTFKGVAKLNVSKILAGIAVLQNDRFWHDWHTFHFLCQPFNNLTATSGELQELSVGQMMVAVDTAIKLRESLSSLSYQPVFSEEVAKFIASRALDEGVWFLPEPLNFASKYASKRTLICKDCNNEELIGPEDEMLCPVCTGKFTTDSLSTFEHEEENVKKGWGRNVSIVEKHPTRNVQKILTSLMYKNVTLSENNPDHVCAAKLAVAIQYLMARRKSMGA